MSIGAVLAEIARRTKHTSVYDGLLDFQKEFVDHSSRYKAILSPRRASKSYTVCSYLIIKGLKKPNARCLYLGLTRTSAKRVAWDHLHSILKLYDIPFTPNKVELSITLENGSIIELSGADSTLDAAEKFLGAAYHAVAIDEAASFNPVVLDYLIDTILNPTLIDHQGTLMLVGTPRAIEAGRFYEATTYQDPRWEIFKWKTEQNPYVRENWLKEIEELKKLNPDIVNEAWFVREYMGEWCKDASDLVYKFSSTNLITEIPEQMYQYILGVDIGWSDDSAFVLTGYAPHDSNFYIIESTKSPEMLPNDIAKQIKYFEKKYQPIFIVADAANKTVIEELKRRYGVNIKAAEKTKKHDWIELMNVDYLLNKIKVVQADNTQLLEEINKLPWYMRNNRREEHPSFPNHLTDSSLYAYRFAYHYRSKPLIKPSVEEKMYQEALAKQIKKIKKHRWER